jgi:predicted RNA methylase
MLLNIPANAFRGHSCGLGTLCLAAEDAELCPGSVAAVEGEPETVGVLAVSASEPSSPEGNVPVAEMRVAAVFSCPPK